MAYLLGCQNRHFPNDRPYFAERLLNLCGCLRQTSPLLFDLVLTLLCFTVFTYDPQRTPIHFARLDVAKRRDELVGDFAPELWELFDDLSANAMDELCPANGKRGTYLTNAITSTALGLLLSPRKSIKTCTTLAATSLNLMAHE